MRTYGEKLRLIRLALRWQQIGLANLLDIPQSHLSQMEAGTRPVPDTVAEQVSFLTGFSPSFFAKPIQVDVPRGSDVWYRKQKNKYRKADESHAYCQLVFDTFEPFAESLKPLPCRLSSLFNCTPAEAADHVRNALGIRPTGPIESLTILAESAGIRVIGIGDPVITPNVVVSDDMKVAATDEDEAPGFSFWTTKRMPVVFLRSDIPADLQTWAMGHELIHLVMHAPHHGDVRQAEREAQEGAAELFMPEVPFKDSFPFDGPSVRSLCDLATYWNVSLKAVVLRSHELGLISARSKNYYLGADRNGEAGRVQVKHQKPRFYRQMCELLHGTPIRLGAIAKITGASRNFLHSVLAAHSGKPEHLESLEAV